MKSNTSKISIVLGIIVLSIFFRANESFAAYDRYNVYNSSAYWTAVDGPFNNNIKVVPNESFSEYLDSISNVPSEANTTDTNNKNTNDTSSKNTVTKKTITNNILNKDLVKKNENINNGELPKVIKNNTCEGCSEKDSLSAIALKSKGGFMPNTIWEWFLVIILILVIIIVSRLITKKPKLKTVPVEIGDEQIEKLANNK